MKNSKTLEALEQRRALVGSLGALDFLIDLELRRQGLNGLNPKKIVIKREQASNKIAVVTPKQTILITNNKKNTNDDKLKEILKKISVIRHKLLSLGFTERPLAELAEIAKTNAQSDARAMASRELALWYMREKSDSGYCTALKWIKHARPDASDLDFRAKLNTIELLCYYFLNRLDDGRKSFDRAKRMDEVNPDVMLAWVNYQPTPEDRIHWINKVLAHYNIAPVRLLPDEGQPVYDRLTSAVELLKVTDGPKVTVLIAAYDAAEMLPTALRSLQEQTWQNLEIIVLDDCSPTSDTVRVAQSFADKDLRIRVIRMEQNGGAYVARNRGLDEATGEFVTIHDADDWSHPLKIETQVRFMMDNPEVKGCMSQQARSTSDLNFTRWTGSGQFVITNVSSFMFQREPVRNRLGCWDTVRFGADMELIRRIEAVWGKKSIQRIKRAVFSFQRDSNTSIVADEALGASTMPYGVRRQYVEIQLQIHNDKELLRYDSDPERRCFNVPRSMLLPKVSITEPAHFDVIIASDFRMIGGSTISNANEIECQKKFGIKTAIFPLFRYDFNRLDRPILPEVWNQVDGENVDIIAYGQHVTCDLLILRYPPILYHRQKYIPKISANKIHVIINQPPMSDYGSNGIVRYELSKCAENVRYYFGKDAIWYPIGPQVREALYTHHADELHHINLSDEDWYNIIDINGWDRGLQTQGPSKKLRIGRHSRDHEHKWPATKTDILDVYPDAKDVEVHVLGGASAPEKILGKIPKNWIVHPFGSIHPRDFLRDIDVWIYFAHPDWVESFGRTVIEAMAAGVPVILPEVYRPLFKDAAIYATTKTAIKVARQLHDNPKCYYEQVIKAQNYVKENFGYEMHIKRLEDAGVIRDSGKRDVL